MILVGTVHLDIVGPSRLEHLLDRIKPKMISIESPDNLSIKETRKIIYNEQYRFFDIIKDARLPETIKLLLKDFSDIRGYEILVSLDYAEKTNSQAIFVDHPSIYQRPSYDGIIEVFQEMFKELPDEFAKIPYNEFKDEFIKNIDKAYFDQDILLEMCSEMSPDAEKMIIEQTKHLSKDGFDEEREQYLTDNIISANPDLHIGGMGHIFEGYDTVISVDPLYKRLGNLVTEKIRLCEGSKYFKL